MTFYTCTKCNRGFEVTELTARMNKNAYVDRDILHYFCPNCDSVLVSYIVPKVIEQWIVKNASAYAHILLARSNAFDVKRKLFDEL